MSQPAHTMRVREDERSSMNAAVLAMLYEADAAGDVAKMQKFLTPDHVLHVPGRGLNAGEYWGHAGFADSVDNLHHHFGGVFALSVPVASVTGDDAFTREAVRVNRAHDSGYVWTLRVAKRFRFRDNRIAETWIIPEDQREFDDYWSRPSYEPVARPAAEARLVHDRLIDEDDAVAPRTAELLADMYARFWAGDLRELRDSFAEDVVVNIVGRSAISGIYEGWKGFLEFRDRLMSLAGPAYKLDVVAIAGSRFDAWATEHIRMNRRWDPKVESLLVQMHFEFRDGRIVRMDDFPFDLYAWEAFYTLPAAE